MRRLLAAFVLFVASVTTVLADPTDDVRKALVNLGTATSYHMTFVSKAQKGDVDVVKPDKMHMVAGPVEVITIGGTTYVNARGNWMRLPSAVPQMQNPMLGYVQGLGARPQDVAVEDSGPKTVDGVSYHSYKVTPKDGKSATVYVDGSGVLARIDTDDGAYVKFSNFNAPVKIEAPI